MVPTTGLMDKPPKTHSDHGDNSRFSWVSLRLPAPFEPEVEAEFIHDYNLGLAPFRRTWSACTAGVWIAYLLWDYYLAAGDPVYAAAAPTIAALRIGMFAIMAFLFWHFLAKKNADMASRRFERALTGDLAMITVTMCLLVVVAPVPYDRIYFFDGLMIVIIASALAGLRSGDALRLAGFQALASLLTILWCQYGKDAAGADRATEFFGVTSGVFIASLLGIGSATGILVETLARRTFIAQRDLQRVNQALAQSNDEAQQRMQAVIELKERLRQEAEQRNREKSQFIASAVHDLRQPVQAIVNALYPVGGAFAQGRNDLAKELLDLADRATNALQEQLSAILDISRLESGVVKPDLTNVNLGAMTAIIAQQLRDLAAKQQVRLEMVLPAAPVFATTDAHLFRRILGNFVSNAIKYRDSRRGDASWVRVSLTQSDDARVTVEVADNGIGIARELIDSGEIFKAFFQVNNELAQGDKGVGLGLTIVHALVDLLPEHRLRVDSQVGVGSRFSLDLPAAPAPAALLPDTATGQDSLRRLQGLRVALVEDDDLVRVATERLLRSMGTRCDSYASYEEFAAAWAGGAQSPEVVLSDYRLLNKRTAIDVRQTLTASGYAPKFLVFTGEAGDLAKLPGLAGVVVLRKPLAATALMAALVDAVS